MSMKNVIGLVLVIWLTCACSGLPVVQSPAPVSSTKGAQGAYPVPSMAYPASSTDQQAVTATLSVATSDKDKGEIEGQLYLKGSPLPGYNLYLAALIKDDKGNEIARMNPQASPLSTTDKNGQFRFVNVPAGRYGLILEVISETYILSDPTSGQSFEVSAKAGEITHVGKLDYSDLPIPVQ
jgi:hypothetical protein